MTGSAQPGGGSEGPTRRPRSRPSASQSVRVDRDLLADAERVGRAHGRSARQQLQLWVRVGRELERSPSVTHREIDRLLRRGTIGSDAGGVAQDTSGSSTDGS